MKTASGQIRPRGRKNVFIEYMRFVAAIIIMLWHMRQLKGIDMDLYLCQSGQYAVEFFALLSGFLMARSLDRFRGTDVFPDSAVFLKKKWLRLLQMNVVAFLFAFVLRQFPTPPGPRKLLSRFLRNLPEMLLLSTTGLKVTNPVFNYNGADWYLSAMFLSMVILVPIQRAAPKFYRYFCIPAGFLLLGIVMRVHNGIAATDSTIYGVFVIGNLRIAGELLLGSGAYYLYTELLPYTARNRLCVFCIRMITLCAYAGYILLMFRGMRKAWGPAIVIILTVLLVLSFLYFDSEAGSGARSAVPSPLRVLGEQLGAFSLPLYLNHRYWVFVINKFDPAIAVRHKMALCIVLSIISSFVCLAVCRMLSAIWRGIRPAAAR